MMLHVDQLCRLFMLICQRQSNPMGKLKLIVLLAKQNETHCFCFNSSENIEMPPPLPPRRRPYNHVYTPVSTQTDSNSKTRKSTWNLKNVFGRTKPTGSEIITKTPKSTIEFTKSQTTSGISQITTDDRNSNLLANCKNSFSTPDLTNVIDITCAPPVPTPSTKLEIDENDLDVMDIERSNSLNCSTGQFLCRPAPLNISANILWSHNLSVTLSSSCDSSAINLVGANVNNPDSFLGHDMSGYCKMAPIIRNTTSSPHPHMQRQSTTITSQTLQEHNQLLLNSTSVYCSMAPILPKTPKPDNLELTKNITFERHFEFDEECPGFLDCSMKSMAGIVAPNDETSSSGVSSDDGIVVSNLNTTKSTSIDTSMDLDRHDDAISMTYTESPPQSAKSIETPFNFHSTKFDEKLPSYFPNQMNTPCSYAGDVTKYTVNNKNIKGKSIETPTTHITASVKKSNYKIVIKTPTTGKVQKLKQRRNSVSEPNNQAEVHPLTGSYRNENWCMDDNQCKFKTMPKSYESKSVLSHLDPNTKFETHRQSNYEKNIKITRATSSPRRIYNKCAATMAIRLKTPPTTPIETIPTYEMDTNLRASNSDMSSGSLIRSWTRFRRIDFSPLKSKINNILQRTNSEF